MRQLLKSEKIGLLGVTQRIARVHLRQLSFVLHAMWKRRLDCRCSLLCELLLLLLHAAWVTRCLSSARSFVYPRCRPADTAAVINEFMTGLGGPTGRTSSASASRFCFHASRSLLKIIDRRRTLAKRPLAFLTSDSCAKYELPVNNVDETNEFALVAKRWSICVCVTRTSIPMPFSDGLCSRILNNKEILLRRIR